jgi:chemotaxis signal transduction protein
LEGGRVTRQVLVVSAGGRRLALDLALVAEIVEARAITTLPRLPRAFAGVIDVRGSAVPVLWAAGEPPATEARRPIVIGTDGLRPLAMVVDRVDGIVDADDGDTAAGAEILDPAALLEAVV